MRGVTNRFAFGLNSDRCMHFPMSRMRSDSSSLCHRERPLMTALQSHHIYRRPQRQFIAVTVLLCSRADPSFTVRSGTQYAGHQTVRSYIRASLADQISMREQSRRIRRKSSLIVMLSLTLRAAHNICNITPLCRHCCILSQSIISFIYLGFICLYSLLEEFTYIVDTGGSGRKRPEC